MQMLGLVGMLITVAILALLWVKSAEPVIGPGNDGQAQYEEAMEQAVDISNIIGD